MTARRCNRRRARAVGCRAFSAVNCAHDSKRAAAEAGETVALGKLDTIKTGDTLSSGKTAPPALVERRAVAAGAGDRAFGHRSQGRRQTRPGAAAAERGRSLAVHDPQSADPRHRAVGAGRDAFAGRAGAAARALRRQRQIASAGDRLSGDHPQTDHPARPAQEAIRRPWPVRRRGAGDQANAARRRLRVSRKGRRRRGAAQLYRRGRGGRGRRAACAGRSAFPSSTCR